MSKQVSKDWLEREKTKILNRIKSGELQTIKEKLEKDIETKEANKSIPLKFPLLSEQEIRGFNGAKIQDNQTQHREAIKNTNEVIKQQPKDESFFAKLGRTLSGSESAPNGTMDSKILKEASEKAYKDVSYLRDNDETEKRIKDFRENSDYDKTTDTYLRETYALHNASKKTDKGTGVGKAWKGISDRAQTEEFLTFGASNITKSQDLLNASEDYIKRFEELRSKYKSDEQTAQAVLEQMPKVYKNRLLAYTLYQEEQNKQNGKISNWYQGGQVFADMLPFAAQLGLSKVAIQEGMGALLKVVGKNILEKGTQEALKKTLSKQIGKKAVKTIGTDIATAGLNTVLSPMTREAEAEEFTNKRLFENRDITFKDLAKVYTQQAIENLSETIGGDSARWLVRNGAKELKKATGRITSPLIKRQ